MFQVKIINQSFFTGEKLSESVLINSCLTLLIQDEEKGT